MNLCPNVVMHFMPDASGCIFFNTVTGEVLTIFITTEQLKQMILKKNKHLALLDNEAEMISALTSKHFIYPSS